MEKTEIMFVNYIKFMNYRTSELDNDISLDELAVINSSKNNKSPVLVQFWSCEHRLSIFHFF